MDALTYLARGAGAVGGFLVGYGLLGESPAAAVAGAVLVVVAASAQEFAGRRDPRLDPLRVLYLTLFAVAGFLTGWGLADETWLAVVAGLLLVLVAAGLMWRTKQRERQGTRPADREG